MAYPGEKPLEPWQDEPGRKVVKTPTPKANDMDEVGRITNFLIPAPPEQPSDFEKALRHLFLGDPL